jgi:hypothetical protein
MFEFSLTYANTVRLCTYNTQGLVDTLKSHTHTPTHPHMNVGMYVCMHACMQHMQSYVHTHIFGHTFNPRTYTHQRIFTCFKANETCVDTHSHTHNHTHTHTHHMLCQTDDRAWWRMALAGSAPGTSPRHQHLGRLLPPERLAKRSVRCPGTERRSRRTPSPHLLYVVGGVR